jgi:hypothetical protein
MAVDLTHPAVTRYLDDVAAEAAQAGLPAGRRVELDAELRAHLAEALGPEPDDLRVRTALDRLGSAAEIVAAECVPRQLNPGPVPVPPVARPASWPQPRPASAWGVGEVMAVVCLTLGTFMIPVLGPVVGLVLAWASPRWTRTEKLIATVLTALPVVALGGAVFWLLELRSSV